MEWTADVSAGDWLRERIDDPWRSTMHDVVPRGFPAYARVFHPATRSRPVGVAWPPLPYEAHWRAWEEFGRTQPEVVTEQARWSDAADAFGTRMHADAQWGALVRGKGKEWNPDGWQQTHAADGWQFDAPPEGQLEVPSLSALLSLAVAHTTTPDDGFIALWEGWGGVTGAMGYGPSRAFITIGDDAPKDAAAIRHDEFLSHSTRDVFNDAFRAPSWQPGALSDEISRGPRLTLPNRDFVLFRGAPTELVDPDWILAAPWRDRAMEEHGFPPSAESPSIVWPADRAWVTVSEIDWDSTIVGGSPELIRALCTDDRLEALAIREGAELHWDSDRINK